MKPFPSDPFRLRAPRRMASLAALLIVSSAILHTGCEGGSTGVDNPGMAELPVEFRDEAGGIVQARGALEIYAWDHDPAVDSAPLLRLKVDAAPGIRLTAGDFDRILAARAPKLSAAVKRSAAEGPAVSDSLLRFNLVFRGDSGSGAVAAGLIYVPGLRRFVAEGGVRMLPRPLLRFAASLHREAVLGVLGRVILPGTPFQATLADSGFVFEGLPEGRFSAQLLAGDGYLYAVRESLDTRAGHAFTAAPDPIGRIAAINPPAGFGVDAGTGLSTNPGQEVGLQGRLLGADSNDSRVSILWRFLDKAPGDSARIVDPTRLRTSIRFPALPGYNLELSATLGAFTVRDTVYVKVFVPAVGVVKFLAPLPGDTLVEGQSFNVGWEYTGTGPVRLEVSYQGGADGSWSVIADSLPTQAGMGSYAWTPAPPSSSTYNCSLRLKGIPSDSVLGILPGIFVLGQAR